MDDCAARLATYYPTSVKTMIAESTSDRLKEDALKLRTKDLHERRRARESYRRLLVAEAH